MYFPIFFLSLTLKSKFFTMTNKRKLKRAVNLICSDLFAECVAASMYSGKPDSANVEVLLTSILGIHSDFIRRISHPEPGMSPKTYFKHFRKDFNEQVAEIVDQINNLS